MTTQRLTSSLHKQNESLCLKHESRLPLSREQQSACDLQQQDDLKRAEVNQSDESIVFVNAASRAWSPRLVFGHKVNGWKSIMTLPCVGKRGVRCVWFK